MKQFLVESLDDVDAGKAVALYGAGDYGIRIMDLLKSEKNINVTCMIDTFKDGGGNGIPVVNIEKIDFSEPDFDEVLITADSWSEICFTLLEKGFGRIRIVRIGKTEELNIKQENPILYYIMKGKDEILRNFNDFSVHLAKLYRENQRCKSVDAELNMFQDDNTFKAYIINKKDAEIKSINHHNSWQVNWHQWRYAALAREYFGEPAMPKAPIADIPHDLADRFSMDGRAEITYNFVDGSRPLNYRLIYTDDEINAYTAKIADREYGYYGQTDIWLYEALEKYPVTGKSTLIIGSICPWYESICLHYGGKPFTVDYNGIISKTDRIRTMTVQEFGQYDTLFESSFSISSIEHDGLGAYGDPIDPDADLRSMKEYKRRLNKGALLYFSVPVGKDKVIFNEARVYGKHRLPLVLDGWEVVDTFGYTEDALEGNGSLQPVFVLKNI